MSRPSPLVAFVATYALLYAGFGMQSPFIPALLRDRGFQAQDLGLVLAAAMVVRVIAGPIVAHAADLVHRHTVLLFVCAMIAALATISLLLAPNSPALVGIVLCHAAMLGPIAPMSDALAATAAQFVGEAPNDASTMAGCEPRDQRHSLWVSWWVVGRLGQRDWQPRSRSAERCWLSAA